MEVVESIETLTSLQLFLFYLFVVISILVVLKRFGANRHVIFVTILYSFGLFGFIEYQFGISSNIYKVIIASLLIFVCGKGVLKIKGQEKVFIYVIFLLFSTSYLITHLVNGQLTLSVISQYVLSYTFPFIVYQGYKNLDFNLEKKVLIIRLISYLLGIQVILSIIKMGILGGVMEYLVGSIQFIGGGTAVSLPILSLLFLWVLRSGKFEKRDWLIAISFLVIAIASIKRTPVLMFPFFLILLFSYANSNKSIFSFVKYVPVFFTLVYVGVRLNYTLNPEGVIWGSFDLEYLYNYILMYNFGTTDLTAAATMTSGRGGALFMLTHPEALGFKDLQDTLFGNGVSEAVREESGRFIGGEGYGIEHIGLMGSVVIEIYKLGYLGAALFLLFIFSLINQINNNKFKFIISLWLFVDVFLYYGTTVLSPAVSFLFVLIIILASKDSSSTANNRNV